MEDKKKSCSYFLPNEMPYDVFQRKSHSHPIGSGSSTYAAGLRQSAKCGPSKIKHACCDDDARFFFPLEQIKVLPFIQ